MDIKLRALSVFGSQVIPTGAYSMAKEAIEGLAKFRGYQAGVDVAEAFEVGKFIMDV